MSFDTGPKGGGKKPGASKDPDKTTGKEWNARTPILRKLAGGGALHDPEFVVPRIQRHLDLHPEPVGGSGAAPTTAVLRKVFRTEQTPSAAPAPADPVRTELLRLVGTPEELDALLRSPKINDNKEELKKLLEDGKAGGVANVKALLQTPKIRDLGQLKACLAHSKLADGAQLRRFVEGEKITTADELIALFDQPKVSDGAQAASILSESKVPSARAAITVLTHPRVQSGEMLLQLLAGYPTWDAIAKELGPSNAPDGRPVNLTSTSTAANPKFEDDAKKFEDKLAGVATAKGQALPEQLCSTALTYMKGKVALLAQPTDDLKVKLNEQIAKCGEIKTSWAGAVGSNPEVIAQILRTSEEHKQLVEDAGGNLEQLKAIGDPPSLRERMAFIRNFGRAILSYDIVSPSGIGPEKVANLLQATDQQKAAFEAFKKKCDETGATANIDTPASPSSAVNIMNETPTGAPPGTISGTGNPAGRDTQAINQQDDSRVSPNKAGQGPGAPGSSSRTVGDMQAAGMPLTNRELEHQGLVLSTDILKWNEGDRMWLANEKNKWVEAIRELSLPFAGGPSGFTNAFLNSVQLMGQIGAAGSMVDARLSCLGYLLNIHAHSAVEVLAAASGFGCEYTAGPDMYENIAPLDKEGDLRPCGRPGGEDGKMLFPGEPDPTSAKPPDSQ